jgi:hypothetical protein
MKIKDPFSTCPGKVMNNKQEFGYGGVPLACIVSISM